MQKHRQGGFTIIELMIVITIIGVLSAIAIPAYNTYTTRSKVSEGMLVFAPAKQAITEYQLMNGEFPADNDEAALKAPSEYAGKFVESMTVGADGVTTVKFDDPTLYDGSLVFTPSLDASGSVAWECSTSIPHKLVPTECRN